MKKSGPERMRSGKGAAKPAKKAEKKPTPKKAEAKRPVAPRKPEAAKKPAPAPRKPEAAKKPAPPSKSAVDKVTKAAKPAVTKPAGAKPAAPAGKPVAGAKPAVAGAKPAVAGAKPGVPGAKPGVPGAKPGVPGAKPGVPGAKPGVPGAKKPGGPKRPDLRRPDSGKRPRPKSSWTEDGPKKRFREDDDGYEPDEDTEAATDGDEEGETVTSAEDVEDELVVLSTPALAGKLDKREALLRDALRCQRARDFGGAERHLRRFMEEYPDDARGLIHLANVKRAQGDRQGALDTYRLALKRDPNNPLALWWKADYHLSEPESPDLGQAQQALKKIVQVYGRKKDDVARQWTEQAKSKLRFCESRKFSLESHRFLKAKPGELPSEKNLRKARELLAKARDVYPEDPRNHMNLGSLELQLKNPEAAITHCRAALERNPGYARAHLILGHAYKAIGQLKLAKDAFLSCIELDTENRDKAEAWRARREVEQEIARYKRRFFNMLANRPGEDGEREALDLHRMKSWVSVLEGEPIVAGDLHRDPRGAYVLVAHGERQRYRALPGPEGFVLERV